MSLNPFTIILVALAALVGALVAAYYRFETVREVVHTVWDAIKEFAGGIWDFIRNTWTALTEALEGIRPFIDLLVQAFNIARDGITRFVRGAQDALGPLAGWFNDNVVSTLEAGIEFLIVLFQRLVDILRPILDALTRIFSEAMQILIRALREFVEFAEPFFRVFWDALITIVKNAFEVIENAVEFGLAIIRGFFRFFTELLKGDFSGAFDAIKQTVRDALDAVYDLVRSTFDNTIGFLGRVGGRIWDASRGMFNGIKEAFRDAVNFIIRGWNGLEFRIPGFSLGPIGYSGFTLGVPDIPYLADGGIVNRATLAVIGEAGPEAVIPLDRATGGLPGGPTYNITVQAGVGDPGTIGQSVVEAIRAYERRNGAGWRAA